MKNDSLIENNVCVLEHVILTVVKESVCTLLWHLKTWPHEYMIPLGPYYERKVFIITIVIVPVKESDIGEPEIIVYITSKDNREMDKLLAFGILSGNSVKLYQKILLNGLIMTQIDETQVALGKFIADQISKHRIKKSS